MDESTQLPQLDPSSPNALRMRLLLNYRHLVLKFSPPYISESGRHEATWIGADAVADTEDALLAKVLEAMGDCGDEKHEWVQTSEKRDPCDENNVLLTQRLQCPYCDDRERVITIFHPHPTIAEETGN
jgi:hypothetical protein